jgi:two-component system phosphate regulon sensor histidine kinase PhoR
MAAIQLLDKAWPAAFALFLALAGMPTLVFGILVLTHALAILPALVAWGICTAVATGFGLLLGRDIVIMTRLVRALQINPADYPAETVLLVPGMRKLGAEAIRLIKTERFLRAKIVSGAAEDRALVERLPDPLMKFDEAGALVWRNAGAIAAFGAETSALRRHPALRAAITEAQSSGRPTRTQVTLAVPMFRELDATIIPLGGPLYVLLTDRTRERALEKMRADFVANASHELRTPLSSLIGFIETLRGPARDDSQARERFLEIMDEQAARMQRVIADLLSLSRIEISEHQPPSDMISLAPVLTRVAAAMEPMLRAANTRLDLTAPEDLPAIPADTDQLTQIFTNLLDNAIKYGKRGGRVGITARAAVGDTRFEPNGIVIEVSDDGPGISREHIPRLTERFYRVDKGRSRAVGGTGLGLAIVKHVINRHRGRLLIDSAEGKGTTFLVWLPGPS